MKKYITQENSNILCPDGKVLQKNSDGYVGQLYLSMFAEVEAGKAEIIPFDHEAKAIEDAKAIEQQWAQAELNRADIELFKTQDGEGIGDVGDWRTYRKALRKYYKKIDGERPVAPDA